MRALLVIALLGCGNDIPASTPSGDSSDASTLDARLVGTWTYTNSNMSLHADMTFRADGSLLYDATGSGGTGCMNHSQMDGVWANEDPTTLWFGFTAERAETTGCANAANDMPLHDVTDFTGNLIPVHYVVNGTTLLMSYPDPADIYMRK